MGCRLARALEGCLGGELDAGLMRLSLAPARPCPLARIRLQDNWRALAGRRGWRYQPEVRPPGAGLLCNKLCG